MSTKTSINSEKETSLLQ